MSYHQVEDIVEDAIYLVHQSPHLTLEEKRSFIFNLYRFQSYHDTSYTHFRVYPILKEVRFLYEWPLEKHPNFNSHSGYFDELDLEETHWIPGNLTDSNFNVFVREMEGQANLYFDAGDNFWERVKENLPKADQKAPLTLTMPEIFFELLQLGEEQKDFEFVKKWYATFANQILDFEWGEEEGIPDKFEEWLTHPKLIEIREFAERHKEILLAPDKEVDELYSLPSMEIEQEFADTPGDTGKIAFLLNFEIYLADLKRKHKKTRNPQGNPSYFNLAYSFFRGKLDDSWQDGIKEFYDGCLQLSFWKRIKAESCEEEAVFTTLIFQLDKKAIQCKMGIQNGLILKWQNRQPIPRPEYQHFIQDLTLYLQEEELENNPYLGVFGEWKYEFKRSTPWLKNCLEDLWSYYQKYSPAVYEFYTIPFSTWGQTGSSELMSKRAKALEKSFNFFGNEMDFKLAIAFWHHRQGNPQKSQYYVKQIENILAKVMGSQQLRARIRQGLSCIQSDKGTYPEISTIFSGRLKGVK